MILHMCGARRGSEGGEGSSEDEVAEVELITTEGRSRGIYMVSHNLSQCHLHVQHGMSQLRLGSWQPQDSRYSKGAPCPPPTGDSCKACCKTKFVWVESGAMILWTKTLEVIGNKMALSPRWQLQLYNNRFYSTSYASTESIIEGGMDYMHAT